MEATRLADLLVGLSRVGDLGFGLEAGSAARSCVLATRLATSLGLPDEDVQAAFYTALLHHVGCVGYAPETARLFGDDVDVNAAIGRTDTTSTADFVATFLPALMRGRSPLARIRVALTAVARGEQWGEGFLTAACEVGRHTAAHVGLPAKIQDSVYHVFDDWRGPGQDGVREEGIPIAARLARLAGLAVLLDLVGGPEAVTEGLKRRAGRMLDPELVARWMSHAPEWFADLGERDPGDAVLDAEPRPYVLVPDIAQVACVFGDLADLKSAFLVGHSRGVALLARRAAEQAGSRVADKATDLEVAGLLHDVGRVAVSSGIWNRPGRLSPGEWEQVRLHPYYSERILAASRTLARLAPLVGSHHERLDGSGYYRGSAAAEISWPARLLAVADTYRAAIEPRPHRPAHSPARAADVLAAQARRGVLDAVAVDAVIAASDRPASASASDRPASDRPVAAPASDQPTRRDAAGRHPRPTPLSPRECEVLDLLAHGCSNTEIADRLVISPRTAEHHVQHIYTKIGTSSRAAATLYAVEHGLLRPNG